jgi:hypothetical protein
MNNTIVLRGCLEQFKAENALQSLPDDDAFELFGTLQMTKDSEVAFTDIEDAIVDEGSDGGIDVVLILVNDQCISSMEEIEEIQFIEKTDVKFYIVQAKNQDSFREAVIDKLYISLPELLELNRTENDLLTRFNPKLVEKFTILRKTWLAAVAGGAKIHISFGYLTRANEKHTNAAFDSKVEQILSLTRKMIQGAHVAFCAYSAKELLELYQRPKSARLELRFRETPIVVQYQNNEYGYIGLVSLIDYHHFIVDESGSIRDNIFEGNIRHFQGDVDVNTAIQNTVEKEFRKDFWWLNNGITIVASGCGPLPKSLFLDDPQVVNGLQTSYTIGRHLNTANVTDPRSVLVKVIISKDKETVDKVVSASNSQNPISPALLRATDELQRKIELHFSNKGFFYDRRKSYYRNLGKPANRIFGIQYTAQAIEAILNRDPASARAKPTSLIKSDKSYGRIFRSSVSFDAYLNCCLLGRSVYNFMSMVNPEHRGRYRNFMWHAARVLTSVLTDRAEYTADDIAGLNVNSVDGSKILESFSILTEVADNYVRSTKENIINVAKSKKFVDLLSVDLQSRFPSARQQTLI